MYIKFNIHERSITTINYPIDQIHTNIIKTFSNTSKCPIIDPNLASISIIHRTVDYRSQRFDFYHFIRHTRRFRLKFLSETLRAYISISGQPCEYWSTFIRYYGGAYVRRRNGASSYNAVRTISLISNGISYYIIIKSMNDMNRDLGVLSVKNPTPNNEK